MVVIVNTYYKKEIRSFKRRNLKYFIFRIKCFFKGYKVEVIKESDNNGKNRN